MDLFLKQWLRNELLKQQVVSAVHSDFVLLLSETGINLHTGEPVLLPSFKLPGDIGRNV